MSVLLHRKSKPRNLPLFTSVDDQSRPLTYSGQFWVTCNLQAPSTCFPLMFQRLLMQDLYRVCGKMFGRLHKVGLASHIRHGNFGEVCQGSCMESPFSHSLAF